SRRYLYARTAESRRDRIRGRLNILSRAEVGPENTEDGTLRDGAAGQVRIGVAADVHDSVGSDRGRLRHGGCRHRAREANRKADIREGHVWFPGPSRAIRLSRWHRWSCVLRSRITSYNPDSQNSGLRYRNRITSGSN